MTLIFRIVFFAKKGFCRIFRKITFSLEPGRIKKPFRKKLLLLHIFLCSFAYIPINKNTSILRKFKKAISKFKKKLNNNIFYEKSKFYFNKLTFIIYNYIFILYLCYYLFFLDSLLKLSDIRLGIKFLFSQNFFLKRSKKNQGLSFVRRVLTSTVPFSFLC